MTFSAVSPETWRTARVLTGVAMAAFLAARYVPRHTWLIRAMTLAAYLAALAGFIVWGLVR
jgi:hypothetical protein